MFGKKECCVKCKKIIKEKHPVNIGLINHPLLYGYYHTSCFLILLYEMLEEQRITISSIEGRVSYLMGEKKP
jgi:hypothetical protein